VLTAVAVGVCFAAAAAEPAPAANTLPFSVRAVAAPHYGDTLFHFYQDHFFNAITGLMVSQHFQRVAPHDDEAEVLRGGMLLSYGLHDQAADIFAKLIERNAPPAVRDRAWFFLARMRHQRGLVPSAQDALDRIGAPLAGGLEDERQLLQAQLHMARQDYVAAATVLEAIKGTDTANLYARFNLGVALIKTGGEAETTRGTALLHEVGQAGAANEELRSLRDRANVALGFVALQDKKPREARAALQRVRLNGPLANKALLGYGWAASELNDPRLALVPWTELATRDLTDAAVLEAQIAVPFAMAEIGAYLQALERYRGAAALFSREKTALDESVGAIRAGTFIRGLLQQNPVGDGQGLDAFARLDQLPDMPHTTHLVPLLADHPFQEDFKHLRDLQFLQRNLAQWQDSLGSFTDMLDTRREAFAQRLPVVRERAGIIKLPQLQERRDALAAELARADEIQDAAVFADPRERGLLERITRSRAALTAAAELLTADERAEAQERLRRAEGALNWQLTQQLSDRAWVARKGLRDTERAIADARARDAALLQAQRDEPERQTRFAARMAELAARIQALQPRVAQLDAEVQAQLQDIAVAELQNQKDRLDAYAAQATLAIAQIMDRAQLAQKGDAPAAPAEPTVSAPAPVAKP
jgi:hypothetical protein